MTIGFFTIPGGASGKEPTYQCRQTLRDSGSIPGSGKSPEEGHGDPLQQSCLENPMDREAWWAIVHNIVESRTQLKRLNTHAPSRQAEHHVPYLSHQAMVQSSSKSFETSKMLHRYICSQL